MAAPIVYEGAVAPSEPARDGLFTGVKFWVSHRVPQRLGCVRSIQDNGGEVVPMEKNADYMISDPARKDALRGSYSFKFIQDSIEAGTLQPLEEYLCNSSAPVSRPVGSSMPTKGTRAAFTSEDDKILMEWVVQNEEDGYPTLGYEIYKELATMHPHHTYQSWRDHWVKKLRYLPRPAVSSGQHPQPPAPRSLSKSWNLQTASVRQASTQSPGVLPRRSRFTAEEDQLLIEHIRESIKSGKVPVGGNLSGTKIYRDLANDFPQHTYQSWREHWLKQLAPKLQDEIAQWRLEAIGLRERQSEDIPNTLLNRIKRRSVNSSSRPNETPGQPQLPLTRESEVAQSPTAVDLQIDATEALQPANEELVQDAARIDAGDGDQNQTLRLTPGIKTEPQVETEDPVQASDILSQPALRHELLSGAPIQTINKEVFYCDYKAYSEAVERPLVIWPSVKGRAVDIWALWQAVVSLRMDPPERDWQQVAELLNFDWIKEEDAPEELRQCYEKYLAGFEEVMVNFEGTEDDDDDDDEVNDVDQNDQPENAAPDVEEQLPSSPPLLPASKRSFAASNLYSDHAYPRSTPKRRRVDRNGEIPSTPDNVNGTSHLRGPVETERTPSKRISSAGGLLPVARDQTHNAMNDGDDDDEARDEVQELPTFRTRKQPAEPETQDFRFDPETQAFAFDTQVELEEESQNITPSQQLQKESDARSSGLLELVGSSPAPNRRLPDSSQATPTPKRTIRLPFQNDGSDDESPAATNGNRGNDSPRSIRTPSANGNQADDAAINTFIPSAKRRSLPKRWLQGSSPAARASSSAPPPPSPQAPPQSSSQADPQPTPRAQAPAKESPDDVIDRFCSLGYPRDIVLRALQATTWRLGDAGQVMEMLQQGAELPQKTHGVWTPRDDDGLRLVSSKEAPKDAKEERKRAKELRRLGAKHGEELIALRRKYLSLEKWDGA
ncbi:TRF2-interacting telomeric protein/Rap1 C terminal domain-containing protein [Whalleya microplaca]|nr:TRF2-interacting telomeric protein/Rap1 C terminal domain-containing protein [Whalleya microplaca]